MVVTVDSIASNTGGQILDEASFNLHGRFLEALVGVGVEDKSSLTHVAESNLSIGFSEDKMSASFNLKISLLVSSAVRGTILGLDSDVSLSTSSASVLIISVVDTVLGEGVDDWHASLTFSMGNISSVDTSTSKDSDVSVGL